MTALLDIKDIINYQSLNYISKISLKLGDNDLGFYLDDMEYLLR